VPDALLSFFKTLISDILNEELGKKPYFKIYWKEFSGPYRLTGLCKKSIVKYKKCRLGGLEVG